jgi:type II secretion system protein G
MFKKGFTLIEMLIVIVIIGVLAAALIPRISSSKNKATNIAIEKNVRDINMALTIYQQDKGSYPTSSTCSTSTSTFSDCSLASVSSLLTTYISSIPTTDISRAARSFGSGYNVPAGKHYGYIGLGDRYIFIYYMIDTRNGQQYKAVTMPDGQTWMAENLNYKTNNSRCYGDVDA